VTADRPPLLAAVLTAVGGVFVLVGGLLLWRAGTVLVTVFGLPRPWFVGGVVLGLLTIATGVLLRVANRGRRVLGAFAIAFAVASIPLAFGGLVLGFGLTAVGGAMAAARPAREGMVRTSPVPSGRPPPWT